MQETADENLEFKIDTKHDFSEKFTPFFSSDNPQDAEDAFHEYILQELHAEFPETNVFNGLKNEFIKGGPNEVTIEFENDDKSTIEVRLSCLKDLSLDI